MDTDAYWSSSPGWDIPTSWTVMTALADSQRSQRTTVSTYWWNWSEYRPTQNTKLQCPTYSSLSCIMSDCKVEQCVLRRHYHDNGVHHHHPRGSSRVTSTASGEDNKNQATRRTEFGTCRNSCDLGRWRRRWTEKTFCFQRPARRNVHLERRHYCFFHPRYNFVFLICCFNNPWFC